MRFGVLFALALYAAPAAAGQSAAQPDAISMLINRLEQATATGNRDAVLALGDSRGDTGSIEDFFIALSPTPARLVIKERDRTTLNDGIERLLLEVFSERGIEARVGTWRVDVRQSESADGRQDFPWRIARMERISLVTGLYRLSLDTTRQFAIHNLTVTGPDVTLSMPGGSAFVAETPEGTTAVVLLGHGLIHFAPPDPAERTQMRILSGDDALRADFDGALVRVRPSEFASRFKSDALVPRPVSAGDLRRATEVFDENIGKTLQIDLTDLSRDRWSLVPSVGDMIAEIRTRRFGNITYARAGNDAEDITLFDRKRRRNFAAYASQSKLAVRGRFYNEDDLVDYDVLAYEIDASFEPERLWINGTAKLTVKVRAPAMMTMTLRLAESLTVRGVYSPGFGRLLHLRVVGQNSVIVNLPDVAPHDAEFSLIVVFSGRLEPQQLEREAIIVQQEAREAQPESLVIPLEPRYIYSNRSYWYPQSTVTDYATAKLRITVPPDFDVVASGIATGPPAPAPGPVERGARPRKVFVFESDVPVRYLACVISHFNTVMTAELNVPSTEPDAVRGKETNDPAADGDHAAPAVSLVVQANPRQASRGRGLAERSAAIIRFFAEIIGEAPYPSFTLALTESDLPGGHSPPYFAVLNQTLPTSTLVWRNDPVSFENYPTFFLAHELAHQWWGQAVGWKNYHEQWISEGFAQYFAALYAEKERGAGVLATVMRQMRRWAIAASPQGPVYLGYRIGHIKGDSRMFRAVVYNKGAMVLHMLRRLVGDEAFFAGLRKFYTDWRFKKAGTDDFRAAMERASARDLTSFFEAWVYGSDIPRLRFTHEIIGGKELALKFEHQGNVAPVPITVALTYTNGDSEEVIVPVLEKSALRTVSLKSALRSVEVNQDQGALAEIEK